MEFWDLILRGAAIGFFALLAISFARARPLTSRTAAVIALNLGMIAYILASAPMSGLDEQHLGSIIRAIPIINPLLVWLVAVAYFDDAFRLRPWHALLIAPIIAPAFIDAASPLRVAVIAALYLHIAWTAIRTSADDLVEARIIFRRWFFVIIALFGLIVTGVEVAYADGKPPLWVFLLQAAALAAIPGAFLLTSHRLGAEWTHATRRPAPAPIADPLLAKIEAAMAEEIWRTEGLTLGQLAKAVGAPEHKVRAAINRGLGHRNFPAFINGARIDAAKQRLTTSDDQVLTIAHEVGFASIGPFNRAFRYATGLSPTEYRRNPPADS